MVDEHGQRVECAKELSRLWERVQALDDDQVRQREAIARVEVNIINLTASMDRLTRAIWGIVLAVAGCGATFIIWFIQKGG